MNRLHNIMLLLIIISVTACKKDNNNIYGDKEVITITGINASYTTISDVDKITIDPTVVSNEPGADFDYLWGIYETNVQGYAPVLDTICKTKAIDYLVKQPAKGWVLVFRATNKKTGYAQYVTSNINVVTQYTRGWYVAKDDGVQADLDLFLTPSAIKPEGKIEDVYSFINGRKLEGKANMLNLFSGYKTNITGTFANTRTLFFLTDKDVSAININTMKQVNGFDQLFYQSPAVKAPDLICAASSSYYLINNGQCYSISTSSMNTGQFGVATMRDDSNTPYHLSKYTVGFYGVNPYFFDNISSSFVSADGFGSTFIAVSDGTGTAMPANHNNKTVLYMGFKSSVYLPAPIYAYSVTGYAIFQDKTNPSLKILSMISPDKATVTLVNDTLTTSDKIFNATQYTLLDGDENIIYFVTGNQVWSRNLNNGFEQLQFTASGSEEITFIRHRKYTEAGYAYNYVMIGTRSGENYKVRMFTKSSGNLSSTPEFTLEGQGTARDVMYISPSVSEYTYNSLF